MIGTKAVNAGHPKDNEGIINKFVSSIFGSSSADLTNEPTIDYNHTIPTLAFDNENLLPPKLTHNSFNYNKENDFLVPLTHNQSNETTIPTRDNSRPLRYPRSWNSADTANGRSASEGKGPFSKGYNDLFGDVNDYNDNKLDYEYAELQNRLNRKKSLNLNDQYNNYRSKKNDAIDHTTSSLPADYPGKFPKDFTTDQKIQQLERELHLETDLNTKYNKFVSSGTKGTTKRYEELVNTSGKATHNLREIIGQVEKQNEFLSNLNDLVDVNKELLKEEQVQAKDYESTVKNTNDKDNVDYEKEYKQLRKEYIEELSNHQFFYKSYQRLMIKYKELKGKLSPGGSDPNKKLKDKVRLIKATTSQSSIRSICDNLLLEINENDLLLNSYKLELEAANLKIKQLEAKLK